MPVGEIKVYGLRDFQARLRAAENAKPAAMRQGFNEVGQIVVDNAVPLMRSSFVDAPRVPRTGKLERSVRALSTARVGKVVEGTPGRTPYAGWFDFGGSTKRRAGGMDRKFVKRGRVLYPAFDAHQAEVIAALDRVLDRLARIANGGGE